MTGHQIADTDHDNHVQDEDLTQKNDFRLGTLSTEEIPTSAVTSPCASSSSMTVNTAVFGSFAIARMMRRPVRNYSRTSALVSIQLLNWEGYPNNMINASVHSPTFRHCSTYSTRYTLSFGTDTFCSSGL